MQTFYQVLKAACIVSGVSVFAASVYYFKWFRSEDRKSIDRKVKNGELEIDDWFN